jgi:hypothetical protein
MGDIILNKRGYHKILYHIFFNIEESEIITHLDYFFNKYKKSNPEFIKDICDTFNDPVIFDEKIFEGINILKTFIKRKSHYDKPVLYKDNRDRTQILMDWIKNPNLNESRTVVINFKPDSIPMIFDILKDFFSIEQQTELEWILKSGGDTIPPLIFKDNGNRLAHTFRELKENDFILGCSKTDLIDWISNNFKYQSRGKKKINDYTFDYLEKCISRKDYLCKDPLIEIIDKNIKKV